MPLQTKKRPTEALIDLDALAFNFQSSKQFIGDNLKYMAVGKADAYGHGAPECALRLEAEGVDWFGVAIPEEGVELRQAGVTRPILCLGSFWPGQEELIVEHHLTPVVFDEHIADLLNKYAAGVGTDIDIHVKIDTVAMLNRLVSRFDELAAKHRVEKIKTIGDAYMVASGVPEPRADHAVALADMALEMLQAVQDIARELDLPINVRAGMASGPMMAGIIGKRKFNYDECGDPVNLASPLEQARTPGPILLCPNCKAALKNDLVLEQHGAIEIKGVGAQGTWYLNARR